MGNAVASLKDHYPPQGGYFGKGRESGSKHCHCRSQQHAEKSYYSLFFKLALNRKKALTFSGNTHSFP